MRFTSLPIFTALALATLSVDAMPVQPGAGRRGGRYAVATFLRSNLFFCAKRAVNANNGHHTIANRSPSIEHASNVLAILAKRSPHECDSSDEEGDSGDEEDVAHGVTADSSLLSGYFILAIVGLPINSIVLLQTSVVLAETPIDFFDQWGCRWH
ncbi:hypothetical protein BDK51DRAFT_49029 [Blyttiomyces helicus]|uniref:Uncharacterized protein n=1 Tax=Blyttiomyces helicus TaxID=388810 RepID=A0A4P9W2U0_9FUNG|nr:hypothetical protein BDK51DRAFT_49029 [Blyttiomyces helicus]|eukprot:RKO85503.1 hypothetical protein BDK51DRAFT_49029 [Blyttiomyces helicus]